MTAVGVVGEILFYTLKQCVGETAYTRDTHRVWCKIISRMMNTMVPISVAFELKHGSSVNHRGRLQAHNSLHQESIDEIKSQREKSQAADSQVSEDILKLNQQTISKSLKTSNP